MGKTGLRVHNLKKGVFQFWVRTSHGPSYFSLAQAFTPAERKVVIQFYFPLGPVYGAVVLLKIAANPENTPPEGG